MVKGCPVYFFKAISINKRRKETMRKNALFLTVFAMVLTLCASSPLLGASDYSTRTINVILPFSPGGGGDVPTRAFAAFAEKYLGKPVVVVYKPGATGMVGMLEVAKSAPDGYTLAVGSTATTGAIAGEIANNRKPLVTQENFVTIGTMTASPYILLVPYDSPWKTLPELINDIKSKPGHYAYSSGGLYSGGTHAAVEALIAATGIKVRHVPYSGGGPSVTALVGGHVDFSSQAPTTCVSLVQGKKLRALALQGDRRIKSLPDVPTTRELGLSAEHLTWTGILAPKGTPEPIVDKLKETLAKAAVDRSFMSALETAGDEVRYMDGPELAKFWEVETERITKLWINAMKEAPPPSK